MRILLLTQIVPYPPDAGPKIKTWHVLRYLVEHGHQVTLVSFVRRDEEKYLDVMRKICHAVYAVPIKRSRVTDIFYWFRSHLTGRPFLVERDDRLAMKELVEKLLVSQSIDVIHADQLTMAQFALHAGHHVSDTVSPLKSKRKIKDFQLSPALRICNHPALIFDAHNAVWTILERMSKNARWYLKPVIALESRKVKYYEGQIIRYFDHTLAVTEMDRQALQEAESYSNNGSGLDKFPITVIPIAVDTHQLKPIRRRPCSRNILTISTLHYPPNADGIRWFIREVFPLICHQVPEVTLTVVGKNPPSDLLRLANQEIPGIQFTGYVADLNPLFEEAALMVVPVRAGGGMRVRILDGFAHGMPIVTTTIGLEGIAAQPEKEVVVRDDPIEFAQAVITLLKDETLQAQLAENGRRLVEKRYDWEIVLKEMDSIYTGMWRKPFELEVGIDERK